MNEQISLSVLVPVYNEQYLVGAALDRLKLLASSDVLKRVEIIVVDDGSPGRAKRFNAWMADVIKPFRGERILEIGAGTGNLTLELTPRSQYVTSDNNPLYLTSLESLCSSRPYLKASFCDVTDGAHFAQTKAVTIPLSASMYSSIWRMIGAP